MSFWPIRSEIRPAFDGGLLQSQFLIGGIHVVQNKTQRNSINLLRRKLDATTTTLAIVLDDNKIYRLINNPSTNTTTDSDWSEFTIGETSSFRPIGEWDADNDNPVLQDTGALGLNGQFYFVTNAPTQRNVTYTGLFGGATETVTNGDLIVSVGDKWIVVTSSVNWDAIQKPSVITDYVNGTVIAHTHTSADITDLAGLLDAKYDVNDTADHTIDFMAVPDQAIVEVEFLRKWYYTKQDIDILLDLAGGGGSGGSFLGLSDTPNGYSGEAGKFVRVNATEDELEFASVGGWSVSGTTTLTDDVIISGLDRNLNFGEDALDNFTEFLIYSELFRVITTNGSTYGPSFSISHSNGTIFDISVNKNFRIFSNVQSYFTANTSNVDGSIIKIGSFSAFAGNDSALLAVRWRPPYSSGSFSQTTLLIDPDWAVTGTFSGTLRGIYYNPTLTSLADASHIAFENTSGELRFGGVTQDDTKSQILVKDETTNRVFWRDVSSISGVSGLTENRILFASSASSLGSSKLVYSETSTAAILSFSTIDGSDNNNLVLSGGGGTGASIARGGYIVMHGNEALTNPGVVGIHSGLTGSVVFTSGGVGTMELVSGNVRIGGATTPDRRLHVMDADTDTNTVLYPLRLTREVSTGNGANNIGVGMEFEVEDGTGDNFVCATIEAVATLATVASSADADIVFKTVFGGTVSTKAEILSSGAFRIPNMQGSSPTLAGHISIASLDSSDGASTLGLFLEQTVESIGTFTPSHKLKIKINGVEYWIQLDQV